MQKFYRLSVNIVKILTLLLAVFLFIGSFLTTCYAENMETQQVLLRFDNPLWNLLELAGYGLLSVSYTHLKKRLDPRQQDKATGDQCRESGHQTGIQIFQEDRYEQDHGNGDQ